jgi:hypothetical protein
MGLTCGNNFVSGSTNGHGYGGTLAQAKQSAQLHAWQLAYMSIPVFLPCPAVCPNKHFSFPGPNSFKVTAQKQYSIPIGTRVVTFWTVDGKLTWKANTTCLRVIPPTRLLKKRKS